MPILTKEALLKGSKNIQKIELTTIDGSVYMKPLTQAEVTHYNSITAKAMGVIETGRRLNNVKVNVEKSTKATHEAQCYALSVSLSCKEQDYSEDEVAQLDGALFRELFQHCSEISGLDVNVEEDVEQFLENTRG